MEEESDFFASDAWGSQLHAVPAVDAVNASSLLRRMAENLADDEERSPANASKPALSSWRQPFVFRNLPVGACIDRWHDPAYLVTAVGTDKLVSVHESSTPALDFLSKNFSYKMMTFGVFMQKLLASGDVDGPRYYYFRATADNSRSRDKNQADIFRDFPILAADFCMPNFINKTRYFSSVLRLSSPGVKLWLHYDIMDNILVQAHGNKLVLLFAPCDAKYLYMEGDKSVVREFLPTPDFEKFPLLRLCRPYLAKLNKGDTLFIPALWLHYVIMDEKNETHDENYLYSIAVNIFWRHLDAKFYDDRDIYGNKDLVPATKAFDALSRACKMLNELPEPYRTFYRDRAKHTVDEELSG